MKKQEIQTARLRLARIRRKDKRALIALVGNEEIGKTYLVPSLETEEQKSALFERYYSLSASENRFAFGIYLRDRLIGLIHEVEVFEGGMELGYLIHPAEKGNGYATEALSAAITALFSAGYRIVKAGAFAENAASIRVMEKCGMVRTGESEPIEYRGRTHTCIYLQIENKEGENKWKILLRSST